MSQQYTNTTTSIDYKQAAQTALKLLRRDRDRQILAKRFGFGLNKRQTLEKIGRDFGITRERVRQIEKAALAKLKTSAATDISSASNSIKEAIKAHSGLAPLDEIAATLGANNAGEQAYIVFLAELSPEVEVIEENDYLRPGLGLLPDVTQKTARRWSAALADIVTEIAKPTTLAKIAAKTDIPLDGKALSNLAKMSKALAELDGKWGLISWPEVNPKSIRDKTFLVLHKHGRPLHFSDIAVHIHKTGLNKRQVTVQAVHNELIKDTRFVLIGRGIYALADWGYTPGTVADIIADILRTEAPLHKDEIVRRVLIKRQVKTTTIILNLQEKQQFVRVAKATYTLAA